MQKPEVRLPHYISYDDSTASETVDLHVAVYIDGRHDWPDNSTSQNFKAEIIEGLGNIAPFKTQVRTSTFLETEGPSALNDLSMTEVVITSVVATSTAEIVKEVLHFVRKKLRERGIREPATIIVDSSEAKVHESDSDEELARMASRFEHDELKKNPSRD